MDKSVDRATFVHDRSSSSKLMSKHLLKLKEERGMEFEECSFQLKGYNAIDSVIDEDVSERNLLN